MVTISASVGKKGINKYKDVATVQTLLNNNIYRLTPLRPLVVDGEITKGPYAFYLGTQAIEIKHPQFLARYGEIKGAASGLKIGDKVTKDQLIAYVGELRGLNMSMLHLELYKGSAAGPLTVRGSKPYQRRGDLIDPTSILDKSQCKK